MGRKLTAAFVLSAVWAVADSYLSGGVGSAITTAAIAAVIFGAAKVAVSVFREEFTHDTDATT